MYETFSKRLRRQERAGKADVYQYDDLPRPFRVQVIHIWRTAIGEAFEGSGWSSEDKVWKNVHDMLARELGVFHLSDGSEQHVNAYMNFLLNADTLQALDIIELTAKYIEFATPDMHPATRSLRGIRQLPADAIEELNHRFREHAIGYQYENGMLIRVDSQFVHSEVVKPALVLLADRRFSGARDEFLKAHGHYRAGRNKEAIVEALKSFESVMKTICDNHGWAYPANATAKKLIEIVFTNELIPSELQSEFNALAAVLESGIPTVRNKKAGHGQGAKRVDVPNYLAAYALRLTAANILLLVEADKTL